MWCREFRAIAACWRKPVLNLFFVGSIDRCQLACCSKTSSAWQERYSFPTRMSHTGWGTNVKYQDVRPWSVKRIWICGSLVVHVTAVDRGTRRSGHPTGIGDTNGVFHVFASSNAETDAFNTQCSLPGCHGLGVGLKDCGTHRVDCCWATHVSKRHGGFRPTSFGFI